MDLTLILARWMGIFSIIVGVLMFYRRKTVLGLLHDFFKSETARFAIGALEVLAGLFITIIHWEWGTALEIIVSIFGVLLTLEGLFYLFATNKTIHQMLKALKVEKFYYVGLIYMISVGIVLIYMGF